MQKYSVIQDDGFQIVSQSCTEYLATFFIKYPAFATDDMLTLNQVLKDKIVPVAMSALRVAWPALP